jgi:hypothetical protein
MAETIVEHIYHENGGLPHSSPNMFALSNAEAELRRAKANDRYP